jgi:acyl dehydratase
VTADAGTAAPGTAGPETGWAAGRALPPLPAGPVSRTTLALFAGASGDGNPIHIDLDVARSAGLDDVFAHGMLSMAYLARLLTDTFGQQRLRSWKVRFAAITPVHARPVCTGRVTAVSDAAGERLATVDLRVTLADGTETLAGEAVVALD